MPVISKKYIYYIALLCLIVLEFTCYFLFKDTNKLYGITAQLNSIVGFAASVGIGLILLYLSQHKFCNKRSTAVNRWYKISGLLILVITAVILLPRFRNIFALHPVDLNYSDIIPSVQLMLGKFLHGLNPYEPTTAFGYQLYPTYLPMQWLPFGFSAVFGIDYRYTPILSFFMASMLFVWMARGKISNPLLALCIIIPFIIILNNNESIFHNTIEFLIAAYYLFLIVSIGTSNALCIGIALTMCILSRYSLVLWLPLFFYVIGKRSISKMVSIGIIVTIGIAVSYVIPFLSKDWDAYFRGLHHYLGAAIAEWSYNLNQFKKPNHVFNGQGFALFVFDGFTALHLEDKIKLIQKIGFCASLGVSTLFIWIYYRYGNRFEHGRFLISTFKIYMAVFYFFIQVPYVYLMVLPFFISIGSLIYFNIFPVQKNEM